MGNGHMHYSIMLRCLLMIALFIYLPLCLYHSSYIELLNPLRWCRTISNNPDSLGWGNKLVLLSACYCFQPGPLLTSELLIFCSLKRGGLFKTGELVAMFETWTFRLRAHLQSTLKEKRWDSFCSQRMSKSKFAPGQQHASSAGLNQMSMGPEIRCFLADVG